MIRHRLLPPHRAWAAPAGARAVRRLRGRAGVRTPTARLPRRDHGSTGGSTGPVPGRRRGGPPGVAGEAADGMAGIVPARTRRPSAARTRWTPRRRSRTPLGRWEGSPLA